MRNPMGMCEHCGESFRIELGTNEDYAKYCKRCKEINQVSKK